MARGQAYRRWLTGRRVAVVGLARSGVAACRLLVECGARVVATDEKPLSALGAEARRLEKLGVRLLEIGRASCRESVDLGGRRIIKKKKKKNGERYDVGER